MEQLQNNTFNTLCSRINNLISATQKGTVASVNKMLTIRNWVIGAYIVEYEQGGEDRAKYGEQLIPKLARTISAKGVNVNTLWKSRLFYLTYPQCRSLLSNITTSLEFRGNLTTVSLESGCQEQVNDLEVPITPPEELVGKLSFSHITELLALDNPLIRYFYEQESIRSTWSVRELRRQISTNLHIRVGLSKDKLLALKQVNEKAEQDTTALQIRDPFVFEFLGLKAKDVVTEDDLEQALIEHLQEFILELGKGFCFEARQKRIIIDDQYHFIDLVFYNRVLHCNVIVELKNDEFRHEHLGQLNAYVAYYKENEMQKGDNPPVGILLCTRAGKQMVKYATAGMDNNLFVSTYMLHLPNESELATELRPLIKEIGK